MYDGYVCMVLLDALSFIYVFKDFIDRQLSLSGILDIRLAIALLACVAVAVVCTK
jgi:hypothetical protein